MINFFWPYVFLAHDQSPQKYGTGPESQTPDRGIMSLILALSHTFVEIDQELNKKCHKHVTNAPKGIGLA